MTIVKRIVFFLILGVLVVSPWLFWRTKHSKTKNLEGFYKALFSPLDIHQPSLENQMSAFRDQCRQEIRERPGDAKLARLCSSFAGYLIRIDRTKEHLKAKIRDIDSKDITSLRHSERYGYDEYEEASFQEGGGLTPDMKRKLEANAENESLQKERIEQKKKFLSAPIRTEWESCMNEKKPTCLRYLKEIARIEKQALHLK